MERGKSVYLSLLFLKYENSFYIVYFKYFFRVALGNLTDFLSTSCITNLSFLGNQEDGMPDRKCSWNVLSEEK